MGKSTEEFLAATTKELKFLRSLYESLERRLDDIDDSIENVYERIDNPREI